MCNPTARRHKHKQKRPAFLWSDSGAENETRTRDPDLGKVVLYQLSYFRILFNPLLKIDLLPFSKAGAKVLLFFDIRKFFGKKMQ